MNNELLTFPVRIFLIGFGLLGILAAASIWIDVSLMGNIWAHIGKPFALLFACLSLGFILIPGIILEDRNV